MVDSIASVSTYLCFDPKLYNVEPSATYTPSVTYRPENTVCRPTLECLKYLVFTGTSPPSSFSQIQTLPSASIVILFYILLLSKYFRLMIISECCLI